MLTIRFQRTGKRNRAEFRVVVAPKTAAAQKKFTEILGNYNPRTKELVVKNNDRLNYWISQRLPMSPSVQNLFVTKKLVEVAKVKAFALPKKEVAKEEVKAEPVAPAEEVAPAGAEAATEAPVAAAVTEEPAA